MTVHVVFSQQPSSSQISELGVVLILPATRFPCYIIHDRELQNPLVKVQEAASTAIVQCCDSKFFLYETSFEVTREAARCHLEIRIRYMS